MNLLRSNLKLLPWKRKIPSSVVRGQLYCLRRLHFISCGNGSKQKLYSLQLFGKKEMSSENRHRFPHEENITKLKNVKRIIFIILFGASVFLVWVFRAKKSKEQKYKLQECSRIPVNDNLFKSKISLYRYRGFVYPGEIIMSGILQELPKFEFRESDVIVASFPKSGTTWVQEIVYMLTHNLEKSNDSSEVLETRFPYLEYPYPGIKSVAKLKSPRLIKTHLPATILPPSFISSGAKLIYITRNPKDTIVSYWHFMRLLSTVSFIGSFQEFLQLFLSDKVPYGPFYDHLRTYSELETRNILIITYEDLKENPVDVIKNIAEYLEIPVSDSEAFNVALATTFNSMSENKSVNYEHWRQIGFVNENEGKFLRKGIVGDWKNYFTPEMLKDFELWRSKSDPDKVFKFKYNY